MRIAGDVPLIPAAAQKSRDSFYRLGQSSLLFQSATSFLEPQVSMKRSASTLICIRRMRLPLGEDYWCWWRGNIAGVTKSPADIFTRTEGDRSPLFRFPSVVTERALRDLESLNRDASGSPAKSTSLPAHRSRSSPLITPFRRRCSFD